MAGPFGKMAGWKILEATARRHAWKGEGWLSIKSFSGGRAHYSVGAGHHAVGDDSYLVLNHGRTYAIEIDSRQPVDSFCVFFARDFAVDALQSASNTHHKLLDSPIENANANAVEFFEKVYPHDDQVSPVLQKLRQMHRLCEPLDLEEQMHRLIAALLRGRLVARHEADQLPNTRPATRYELYRRVSRARDFVDALFTEPLTLKQIAEAAALSPNHLLRTFAQVYRQTPHQFLTNRRIDEAKRLLRDTEFSVTEICFSIGFQSLGSFSSLFHRRVGISPARYRDLKR